MSPTPVYDSIAMNDLQARTQYEAWLLEAVYDVARVPVIANLPDQLVYPASGAPPVYTTFVAVKMGGNWRHHFLEAGAPLVFVTSFKLLDMLLEWVLERNGASSTFRLSEKIKSLKKGVTFPPFFDSKPWISDRLVGIYEYLEPLRGTIIHSRHFHTSDGTLCVAKSKSGVVSPEVVINADALRNIAVVAVSSLRYVDGSWVMNAYTEKHLRHTLDQLSHLHGLPSLGQKQLLFLTVRVCLTLSDAVTVDLQRIRDDIARILPGHDVVFDLRIVAVAENGEKAVGYLFPWEELQDKEGQLCKLTADILCFERPLPEDVDIASISQHLKATA